MLGGRGSLKREKVRVGARRQEAPKAMRPMAMVLMAKAEVEGMGVVVGETEVELELEGVGLARRGEEGEILVVVWDILGVFRVRR